MSTTHSYLRFEPHADGHEEVAMHDETLLYLLAASHLLCTPLTLLYPYVVHGHEEVAMEVYSTYYLPLAVYTTYPYFIHLPGGHEEVAMDDETLLTY